LLFSKHISIDKINSYGYGIVIAEWEKEGISYKKLYHPGGGDGVRSFNTIYPEKGLYVVMISNIDTKTTFNELIDEIDNILLN
jgi:CubicO group peptidase (beta-lactamase class C family)